MRLSKNLKNIWRPSLTDKILFVAGVLIFISLILALYRFFMGPGFVNRAVAFDVLGIFVISLIGLAAVLFDRALYLDVALVYGLLSFLGIIVIGRFIEKGL